MRRWICLTCAAGLLLMATAAMPQERRQTPDAAHSIQHSAGNGTERGAARAEVIERIKEVRAKAQKVLELNEAEQERLRGEYEKQAEFFERGLIARIEVTRAEEMLRRAVLRVEEDRRYLEETDMAITEASLRDELLRMPGSGAGIFSEDPVLMRFSGDPAWTLADAPAVEGFFLETFGRVLPVSARGQTATHERLRFDHRDAIDVALHPDSVEGQALLKYLRLAGIPFIAFKGAVPGAATGAHIHIGRPSPRN